MLIKAIESTYPYLDRFHINQVGKRTTNYGVFKGTSYVIDNFYENNVLKSKRFVIWNDKSELIINKIRNSKGKFDRLF